MSQARKQKKTAPPFINAVSLTPCVDPLAHLPLDAEVDVDLFAGGGGASTGFEMAMEKSPDLAINHDPEALAMHRANHPKTVHLCQNVINVHPLQATGGRLVRCLWASPDCTHFSKAKGGKPRNQHIRDLAWTVVRWVELTQPLLGGIENVEEFQDWGPLDEEGQPIKERAGEIFRAWVRTLRKLGYSVSWRQLVACDYGAPTTRKRLFVAFRRDKKRVKWPKPTHGPGKKLPHRTAAECINWNDPAPSIFERKKPLAENTQRRIAEGIRRYVLHSDKPFLVTYYGAKAENDFRGQGLDKPLPTVTTENRFGLVSPMLVKPNHTAEYYQCFRGQGADEPLGTITSSPGFAVCSPYLVNPNHAGDNFRGQGVDEPVGTMTGKGSFCLTSPYLITIDHKGGKGEFRAACRESTEPLTTVTTENRHALTTASLIVKNYGGVVGHEVEKPLGTVTATDHHSLVSACLVGSGGPEYGGKLVAVDKPIGTLVGKNHKAVATAHLYYSEGGQHASVANPMPTSTGKARFGLQAVHLQQYNGCSEAQPADEPIPTIPTKDRFGLTAATLCQYNGASECQPLDEPAPTLLGQNKMALVECPLEKAPGHYEEVRDFLRRWCVIGPDEEAEVCIDGVKLRINDIGLRMLRPRELFLANGFPASYNIAPVFNGKPLTITSQVKKCGNSVPPQFVKAVLSGNMDALKFDRSENMNREGLPLLRLARMEKVQAEGK